MDREPNFQRFSIFEQSLFDVLRSLYARDDDKKATDFVPFWLGSTRSGRALGGGAAAP